MPSGLVFYAPRSPGPGQAHVASQRLFRHGLKAFVSKGAFLLQVLADGDQLVIADALFEPPPVGFGTHQRRIAHRDEARVWRHQ